MSDPANPMSPTPRHDDMRDDALKPSGGSQTGISADRDTDVTQSSQFESAQLGSGQTGTETGLRQAGEDLRATARQAREAASQAASTIASEASAAAGTIKQEGAALLDTAQTRASEMAQQGVHAGAEQAEGIARAIHRAADELDKESPQLARTVHDAAGAIDGMARALRDRNPSEILRGAEDFARRQPLAFFGAAALAGFAIARFARSSATHQSGYSGTPYQGGDQRSRAYAGTGTGYGTSDTGMSAGMGVTTHDTMHDMSTAGTGATGPVSTGTASGSSYPHGPSTPHDASSGAPGWVADENGTPRPATLASASLGGAAAYRPRGEGQG